MRQLSNLSEVPQLVEEGFEIPFGTSAHSLPEEGRVSHSTSDGLSLRVTVQGSSVLIPAPQS